MSKELGDKLGPRLAALIGQYVLAARRDHAPVDAKIRQVASQALIDKMGHEVADHIRPLIAAAIDANPDMHPAVRDYLLRTASGRHQLQAIVGNLAMSASGGVLSQLLSNEMAPVAYSVIGANPHLRLPPQTIAASAAAGIDTYDSLLNEAAAQGFDSGRSQTLYQLAQAVPDSATVVQLYNRGLLSQADAMYWIQRGGYGQSLHDPLFALHEDVLSPADLALATLRGTMPADVAKGQAALSGVTGPDFDTLVANTGEPPGAESLMEALRRKFIDPATFDKGIRQSRIRDEWIPVMLALRYSPMSVADAVNAVVQNHLTEGQAQVIADQNGLQPGQLPTLIANAGEPLSRTELEELYNRGEIDRATVEQGLRESRLKDKYVPDALALHVRLPEPRQVVSAISHGVLTKDQAGKLLGEMGFAPDTAALLIAEGSATRLGAHKNLTVAEIRQLYSAAVFTAAQAGDYLHTLGYDATETQFLLRSWDLLAGAAQLRQAATAIRGRYVAHHLTWEQAAAALTQLGVPAAAIEVYRKDWTVERDARIAMLTEAQIVAAHKKSLITGQDAYDRLTALGYSAGDAHILLGVAPGDPLPG